MNKHVILLSAAAVLLFSCSREVDQAIQPGETITFTAAWAGADETRTILQSDGTSVWWDAAEQINVFFSDKASGKFTSTNSQPQAIVDFQGSLPIVVGSVETENPAHAYWAVYPYNTANTCDGESVTLTVPSTQTAKEGTFADKMFPSIATSTNFYLAFYNVCGGVRFTVANEEIASVTFKANNGESLAGKVKVGFEGVPVVKSVVEGVSEVVVNAPTGGFVPGKYYFAALLPQTLSKGMSLTFKKEDGKVASTSLENSITINRSRFGKMEEKDNGLEFKDDGSGHNPTDNIVFADSKVKEKLVAAFDTNGDGELSYEEAAAVTSGDEIQTAFGNIKTYKSFDEFQYFTGVASISSGTFANWNLLSSIILPPSLKAILGGAFSKCNNLTSIIIPDSVTSLGDAVFADCSNLSSIDLPMSMNSIGKSAFANCSSLSSIDIPEALPAIQEKAFTGCTKLSAIILPENVTSIGLSAFENCTSLASVDILGPVWDIIYSAFKGCSSLSRINIPESLRTIRQDVFNGCSSLVSIRIPRKVTGIGTRAFNGCSSLTNVEFSESANLESIGDSAFFGCSSLRSIELPESVSIISRSAFQGCTALESAILSGWIGESAFYGCSNLANIVMYETVTEIRNSAFYSCTSLVSVDIPESVVSIGDSAFYACKSLTTVIIPESVTSIGDSAFLGCSKLATVNIPMGINRIENKTFWNCSSLTSIAIPDSVTNIGDGAFLGCSSLLSISLPSSVTSIGQSTFRECSSITIITIPESVVNIGYYAFGDCTNLMSIIVLPETPPIGGNYMFENTNNSPIYVISESVDTYRTAEKWSDYANRIQAIQE